MRQLSLNDFIPDKDYQHRYNGEYERQRTTEYISHSGFILILWFLQINLICDN